MINYPKTIDNDRTIMRIDDNLSELGSSAINQLREAVFSIEKTLGINPQGSKSSVNDRISVLIGPDGNPNALALQAVGLVTLPITDNQVAANAGIKEIKLDLDFSTSDLHTDLVVVETQLTLVQNLVSEENINLLIHISGGVLLSDSLTLARHVASHIDLNAVQVDSRDVYSWTGLLDINGNIRPATHVAEALLEINNELVGHEKATIELVHPASAVSVDSSLFTQLPKNITNVQDALDFVDNQETLATGVDRATLNSNGIPRTARIQDLKIDGYTINVVPVTKINAFLAEPSGLAPNDNINNGDDVIKFLPDNTNFVFDSQFTNVRPGDILRINYGNGIEARYPIMSVRFTAGTEWAVRVNSNNLFDIASDGYFARIDRPNFDMETWGVLAAAGVVPNIPSSQTSVNSVILGSPRGAVAVGIGFDPAKIDANHYNLYLRLYPSGNPSVFFDLPAIDVSGNQGTTPGYYNIDIIVEATNKKFRAGGYNYRFIAFNQNGEFGIMLADDYNGAAFSIISAQINATSGNIEVGTYTLNVVGDAADQYDGLGLGFMRSGFATPVMSRSGSSVPYPSSIAASNYSTLIIFPVTGRNFIVNGNRRDTLAKPRFTDGNGYWPAVISNITVDNIDNTDIVTYSVSLDLATEGLFPGKTIVVQPIDPNNPDIQNYGRFIIDSVSFSCTGSGQTNITVLNSIHATGNPMQDPLPIGTPVNIYFSDDSVMFNLNNMIGDNPDEYHHYHEVFVNDIGKSVAVERARIPKADVGSVPALPGSGNIGSLSGWRIRRVSPKLKGYRYGITDFRHFVQLTITNYNSTTGEFDIYLLNLDLTRGGPVARGKKNHPVRVYDETYVNFIDIEFREESIFPGTTGLAGWIAIELFPTLIDNNEYFAVAGVSHNAKDFKSITDIREFGTLSEENFTDSAIKFIEAGERYLHANGVVRGLAFQGPGVNSYTMRFTGGLALVNGAFVPVDAMDVSVPVLLGASDTLEFFICVTETGQLKSVLKGTGSEFFDSTNHNFVESLTFKEIVDNRKDLVIIAKATVTTSTGDVVVTDARRHVVNQDLGSFTWAYTDTDPIFTIDHSDPQNANFITAEALMNWVNEYQIKEVKVKNVTINSKLTLNFTSQVILKGGNYTINSAKGLAFESGNWKIDDADIVYNPVNGFTPDAFDNFNTKANWGAILIDLEIILNSNISNFGVENSRFISSNSQRPPFVGIYSATGASNNIFINGRFINNTFGDDVADKALCYAFVNGNTPDISLSAPYFSDILVSGTKINFRQGILVAGRATPDLEHHGYSATNPVLVENFIIKDNRFGLIGYNVSNGMGFLGFFLQGCRFVIENNKAELIYSGFTATMHPIDFTFSNTTSTSTGNSIATIIKDNDCYFMKVEASAGVNQLKTIITGNIIKRFDDFLRNALIPNPVPWAMIVLNQGNYPTHITIADNIIDGFDGLSSGYMHGIYVNGAAATITGNTVNNIAGVDLSIFPAGSSSGGWGIYISGVVSDQHTTITGNTLNRQDGVGIAGYIHASKTSAVYANNLSHFNLGSWSGSSTDNYGDLSDSNFDGITGASFAAWNVNQVVRTVPNMASAIPLFHISPTTGGEDSATVNNEKLLWAAPGVPPQVVGTYPFTTSHGQFVNTGLQKILFNEDGWEWQWAAGTGDSPILEHNDGVVGLIIPISSVIPDRAYLLSLSVTVLFNGPWDIWDNGSGDTHNTYTELVLELNGNVVATANPFSPVFTSSVILNYQSDALVNNIRPVGPLVQEMVVRMRQGAVDPTTAIFGAWLGPTGPASKIATMTISQPRIAYLY